MASGHVNRIKRPNTWLHRPMLQNVKKGLANSEPSTHGTRRTWRDVRLESVVRTIADIRLLGATQGKRSKSLPLSEVRATIDRNRTMEKTHDPYIVRRPEARNRRLLRSRPATRLRCRED